jgi:hypothetical protein
MADTLYKRLGGYDAIVAVADDLLVRLQADPRLARFCSRQLWSFSTLCANESVVVDCSTMEGRPPCRP